MPEEDRFCIPCFVVFCVTATTIVIVVKFIQITCDRNRRVARYPPRVTADVELDDGGNKVVVNPDGEIMAAMTSPSKAEMA